MVLKKNWSQESFSQPLRNLIVSQNSGFRHKPRPALRPAPEITRQSSNNETHQMIELAWAVEEDDGGVVPPPTSPASAQQWGDAATGAEAGTRTTVHCTASLWRSGTSMMLFYKNSNEALPPLQSASNFSFKRPKISTCTPPQMQHTSDWLPHINGFASSRSLNPNHAARFRINQQAFEVHTSLLIGFPCTLGFQMSPRQRLSIGWSLGWSSLIWTIIVRWIELSYHFSHGWKLEV